MIIQSKLNIKDHHGYIKTGYEEIIQGKASEQDIIDYAIFHEIDLDRVDVIHLVEA